MRRGTYAELFVPDQPLLYRPKHLRLERCFLDHQMMVSQPGSGVHTHSVGARAGNRRQAHPLGDDVSNAAEPDALVCIVLCELRDGLPI